MRHLVGSLLLLTSLLLAERAGASEDAPETSASWSEPPRPPLASGVALDAPRGVGRDVGWLALGGAIGVPVSVALGALVAPIATGLEHSRWPTRKEVGASIAVSAMLIAPIGSALGGAMADLPESASISGYLVHTVVTAGLALPTLHYAYREESRAPEWVGPVGTVGASVAGIGLGTLAAFIATEFEGPPPKSAPKAPSSVAWTVAPVIHPGGVGLSASGTF